MLKRLTSLPPIVFAMDVMDLYTRMGVARSAAALAYSVILTLFPFIMCMNYCIGLFHLNLEQLLLSLDQILPKAALQALLDYLSYLSNSQSSAVIYASIITILLCASAGLRTVLNALQELFDAPNRGSFRYFLLSFLLSALLLPATYLSIVVILTGNWFFLFLQNLIPQKLAELLPLAALAALSSLWQRLRYLLLFCVMLLFVMVLYRLGIPRKQLSSSTLVVFSLLSALLLVVCSVLFSWFIGLSSRYALVYGSLASIIVLLVWLYFCGNILLFVAVLARVWSNRHTKAS